MVVFVVVGGGGGVGRDDSYLLQGTDTFWMQIVKIVECTMQRQAQRI